MGLKEGHVSQVRHRGVCNDCVGWLLHSARFVLGTAVFRSCTSIIDDGWCVRSKRLIILLSIPTYHAVSRELVVVIPRHRTSCPCPGRKTRCQWCPCTCRGSVGNGLVLGLDEVDSLVKTVLVLLTLLAATGEVVDAVHDTAASRLVLVLLIVGVVGVSSGELVDEIHGGWWLCLVVYCLMWMGCPH